MATADPPSPTATKTSSDELLRAIQNLDLNMRNIDRTVNQRIDQVYSLFEARATETAQNAGVLRSGPSASNRLPAPPAPVPALPAEVTGYQGPTVRVEAPKFSGHDPGGWIYKVQSYFDYFNTPDDTRLRLVGLLFDSPASDWFLYQHNNNLINSWHGFLEAVRQRFDPAVYEDYMGLLCKLNQRYSVLEYQTEFERLLNKVTGVSENTLISIFIAGLKPPIKREVNLRRPLTLSQTFALARELAANYSDTIATVQSTNRRFGQSVSPASGGVSGTATTVPIRPI